MSLAAVPLEAYEAAPDAFVLTDSRGRLRMINAAAGALLGCDPQVVLGRRCWQIVGLRAPDGAPVCGAECRVRAALSENAPCVRQRATRISHSGAAQELEIFTLRVDAGRAWGVLHMIVPASEARGEPGLPEPRHTSRLNRLTPRETEILRALAAGVSTAGIAEELCISPVTVRNHVRAVLGKLQVNSRLEAVLIWVSQFR